jgi:hypothetical protein
MDGVLFYARSSLLYLEREDRSTSLSRIDNCGIWPFHRSPNEHREQAVSPFFELSVLLFSSGLFRVWDRGDLFDLVINTVRAPMKSFRVDLRRVSVFKPNLDCMVALDHSKSMITFWSD